jgi:signal transduction histidine kinase
VTTISTRDGAGGVASRAMARRGRAGTVAVVSTAAAAGALGAIASVALTDRSRGAQLDAASFAAVVLVYLAVALVISLARPGHAVARLTLAGTAITGVAATLVALGERGLLDHPGSVPAAAPLLAAGLAGRTVGWVLLVAALPLVFPDGHLLGSQRRRRITVLVAVLGTTLVALAATLTPEMVDTRLTGQPDPLGLPVSLENVTGPMTVIGMLLVGVTTVLGLVGLVTRWRNGDPLLRQRLLWFATGFSLPLLFVPVFMVAPVTAWAFALLLLPVPLGLAVAMRQDRLYDVQLAVSRTLTWVALSVVVAGLYAVTVGGVGAMLRSRGEPWVAWLAAGVVAVSFVPLRNALQAGVDRLVYGRWTQPADVLAATGRRLADASDVSALLRAMAAELVDGLGLAHLEVVDESGRVLARSGVPADQAAGGDRTDQVDLTAYGQVVGQLSWSGRRIRDADRALLEDVARQIGGLVHSSHLVDELRRAQERLVLASEDERRRLRRDLHDGLGPALAGLTLQVDTVRNVLGEPGTAADQRLLALRAGIQSTVLDVRRLVEGLRPPALDDLGLTGAVVELAHRVTDHGGCVVDVSVVPAGQELPRLSAAVEVAAYRVAQEALTNVVRHSGATSCCIDLAPEPECLWLRVRDNGSGVVAPRPGGLGLASMHERATEVGGRLDLRAIPGVGTTVAVRLPLARTDELA